MNRTVDNKSAMDRKSRIIRIKRTLKIVGWSVIVICVLAFALNMIFVVRTLRVVNSTGYSSAEILAAAEIDIGTPLLQVTPSGVYRKLSSDYPYVKNVDVKYDFPSSLTIILEVTEPYMALERTDGSYVYLDSDMKVLEHSPQLYADVTLVTGMSFEKYSLSDGSVSVGNDIPLGSYMTPDENLEMEIVSDIIENLENYSILDRLTEINLSVKYNIRFVLDDRIYVELGTSENLDKKFEKLKLILDKHPEIAPMEINVRDYTQGRWRLLTE